MEVAFPKSLVLMVTASVGIPSGCLVCKRLHETPFLKMGAHDLCLPSLPPEQHRAVFAPPPWASGISVLLVCDVHLSIHPR